METQLFWTYVRAFLVVDGGEASREGQRVEGSERQQRGGSTQTKPGLRQRQLQEFFPVVAGMSRAQPLRQTFRAERGKVVKRLRTAEHASSTTRCLHSNNLAFSCTTQNVNGFGSSAHNLDAWLCSLRRQPNHGRNDLLQETHVNIEAILKYQRLYATGRDFRTGCGTVPLSYWSPSTEKKVVLPSWWILVELLRMSHQHTKVTGREEFYRRIGELELPRESHVALGGDFNCTLDQRADRSYSVTASHASPALQDLLMNWSLVGPIEEARPNEWTPEPLRQHDVETHMYHYTVPNRGDSILSPGHSTPLRPWVAGWEKKFGPSVAADAILIDKNYGSYASNSSALKNEKLGGVTGLHAQVATRYKSLTASSMETCGVLSDSDDTTTSSGSLRTSSSGSSGQSITTAAVLGATALFLAGMLQV
ncbi:hypothetical protein ON010_g4398 [Phytophthora cinnamomi]|nr:hypothetical protein ON010_g4398 [Phytophthora cinnamomi]